MLVTVASAVCTKIDFCFVRSVVALAARNVLDEAGANLVRGTIQAVANGISACQGEVLSLTRDVLILQPPVRGTREVSNLTKAGRLSSPVQTLILQTGLSLLGSSEKLPLLLVRRHCVKSATYRQTISKSWQNSAQHHVCLGAASSCHFVPILAAEERLVNDFPVYRS